MARIKFGVAYISTPMPEYIPEIAQFARRAEQLGFDSLWYGEHFVFPYPIGDALISLAVAAGATERIQLGTGVLLTPARHPLLLAKAAATLDMASGGRLLLGVGAGGDYASDFEAFGFPVRERGARTNEVLEVLSKLWTGEPVTHEGRFWQLRNAILQPMPAQRPHPPVLVGGRKEASFRRAARYGDGWLPYFYTPKQYQEGLSKIRQYAAEAGRSLDHFETAYASFFYVSDSTQWGLEFTAKRMRERYFVSADFAPRVAKEFAVTGTPSDCIARLEEYIEAGARHIILGLHCYHHEVFNQLEVFSRQVMPHFRGKP